MKQLFHILVFLLLFAVGLYSSTDSAQARTSLMTVAPTAHAVGSIGAPETDDRSTKAALVRVAELISVLQGAGSKLADRIPVISPESLKAMIDEGADIVIVDVQPKTDYDLGHIK